MAKGKSIPVVELFAGVGGFRVGLEDASPRFKTVWANQWEPGQAGQWAYKCYMERFREKARCVNEDIAQVIGRVPPHDLLVGGFPCQDYSVAHTGAQGIEGQKGVLWWSIYDVVRLRHPKYILLENVDRLLKSPAKQRGRDFGIILRCLQDEGYVVEWRVINAADYGNAQRRRRVFIFAAKKHTKFYRRLRRLDLEEGGSAWLEADGFFAPAFPVEREEGRRSSSADITEFQDLVDVTDHFAAAFHNAGIMAGGKIWSEQVSPKCVPPRPLSSLVERGQVEERISSPRTR